MPAFGGLVPTNLMPWRWNQATYSGTVGVGSDMTVGSVTPPGSVTTVEPLRLPAATGQLPPSQVVYDSLVMKNAVGVQVSTGPRTAAAGTWYTDPTTGVKVWKVTSATIPENNSTGAHDYSEGGFEVSQPWGINLDQYTVHVHLEGATTSPWIADFTKVGGFSNWRQMVHAPNGDLSMSFSAVPGNRYAYVASGSTLYRIDLLTNTNAPGGLFPYTEPLGFGAPQDWLSHDKNDEWFGWRGTTGTVVAWNSVTGQRWTAPGDEIRILKDGDYADISDEAASPPSKVMRLSDGVLSNAISNPGVNALTHRADCRGGIIMSMYVDGASPPDLFRFTAGIPNVSTSLAASNWAGYNYHAGCGWIQSDAQLGGNMLKQWIHASAHNWGPNEYSPINDAAILAHGSVVMIQCDGSNPKLLCHTFAPWRNSGDEYWRSHPRAKQSPDGKFMLFDSAMYSNSGRGDLFMAELPLSSDTIIAPPVSNATYDTLFPNRPIAGTYNYGTYGSWTTIADIRWGMSGFNGGIEGSTYTDFPRAENGFVETGAGMRDLGDSGFFSFLTGIYSSLVSNSEITGNGIGGNVLAAEYPQDLPGGYGAVAFHSNPPGSHLTWNPAYGFSHSSLSRVRSVYVAHWIKIPSTMTPTGGAGYKGIRVQSDAPEPIGTSPNHFFAGWHAAYGSSGTKMSSSVILQGPTATWAPPALTAEWLNTGTWHILETVMVVPSNYTASTCTLKTWVDGVPQLSVTTAQMFSSGMSGHMEKWSLTFLNGGGGFGQTLPNSAVTFFVGPMLIMGSVDLPVPAPQLLPLASAANNMPPMAALAAVLPSTPAGSAYIDPVTGVRVLRVTSASYPVPGAIQWHHNYSNGPGNLSGDIDNKGKYTVVAGGEGIGATFFIDIQRGGTSSNTRQAPDTIGQVSFSYDSRQYRICYVHEGPRVYRYDTVTSTESNIGHFPFVTGDPVGFYGWFQHDKNDEWFTWIDRPNHICTWNSVTNSYSSRTFLGLDEMYIDLNGQYSLVNCEDVGQFYIFDMSANSITTMTGLGLQTPAHGPSIQSGFLTTDVNTGAGITPMRRYDPRNPTSVNTITNLGGYIAACHRAGYPQRSSDSDQWWLLSSYRINNVITGDPRASIGQDAVGYYQMGSGSSNSGRILAFHYCKPAGFSSAFDYWCQPHAQPSRDGKMVVWVSNMSNSSRADMFIGEVPVI